MQELEVVLDAWKAVIPAAGSLRGAKGKGEPQEKLAQARGVMSKFCADYRETPLLETCVVRKAASIGKQKGSVGDVSPN
jgi:hypothetical protein